MGCTSMAIVVLRAFLFQGFLFVTWYQDHFCRSFTSFSPTFLQPTVLRYPLLSSHSTSKHAPPFSIPQYPFHSLLPPLMIVTAVVMSTFSSVALIVSLLQTPSSPAYLEHHSNHLPCPCKTCARALLEDMDYRPCCCTSTRKQRTIRRQGAPPVEKVSAEVLESSTLAHQPFDPSSIAATTTSTRTVAAARASSTAKATRSFHSLAANSSSRQRQIKLLLMINSSTKSLKKAVSLGGRCSVSSCSRHSRRLELNEPIEMDDFEPSSSPLSPADPLSAS